MVLLQQYSPETKRYSSTKNFALTTLAGLDSLTSIGGDLGISNNAALTSLEGINNLTGVGGNLILTGNTTLPTSSCQALADRLAAGGFNGQVSITGNLP